MEPRQPFTLEQLPSQPENAPMTPHAKVEALRKVLLTWERRELRDVINEALWAKEDLVAVIIDNDMLGDEVDTILIEAGVLAPLPVLCGGVTDPAKERALYERTMRGEQEHF